MKCTIPEISWHNRDPVLSVDFQVKNGTVYRLATGGTDSHVLMWRVKLTSSNGVEAEFVCDLKRHNRAVNVVRFSPSGEILASGDDEAAIWLWTQQDAASACKNVPDIFGESEAVRNKENWNALRTLRGHLEDVYDLSWSPDGGHLVSGSVDNSAIIWEVSKQGAKNVGLLSEHKGFVQGVAWDPKNKFLATLCSDRICRVYNVASRRVAHRIHRASLAKNSAEHITRLFHDDTLKSFFRRLAFTPDGELLIAPSGIVEKDDGSVLNVTHVFSRHSLNRPAFYLPSKDRCTVVVRCCPTFFRLRPVKIDEGSVEDAKDKKPWEVYSTMLMLPYRVVFAVATQDSVFFYDTQQSVPFAKASDIQYTQISDLSWSSDGRVLVVSSTDGYCSFLTFDEKELGVPYAGDVEGSSPEVSKVATQNSVQDEAKMMEVVDSKAKPSTTTTPVRTPGHKRISLLTLFSPKSVSSKVSDAPAKQEAEKTVEGGESSKNEVSHPQSGSCEVSDDCNNKSLAEESPPPSSGSFPKPLQPSQVVRQPRRVQLVTLSTPPKPKLDEVS